MLTIDSQVGIKQFARMHARDALESDQSEDKNVQGKLVEYLGSLAVA